MNLSIKKLLICFAIVIGLSVQSKASIETFANLEVMDFKLFVDTGGGVPGAAITNGSQINVVSVIHNSDANANIGKIGGGPVATTNNGPLSPALDTNTAHEGAAGLVGLPNANVFDRATLSALADPHAVADTAGIGTIVAGLTGEPFGATVSTVSQVSLSDAVGSTDFGSADASTSAGASFLITVGGADIDIVGIFDASRELFADLDPSPPGVAGVADNSFNISIINALTGATDFSWDPDGSGPGLTNGGVVYSDPFDLNQSIAGFPGLIVGPISDSGTFSVGVTLLANTPYTLNIEHSSSASAATLGIPEPSSVLVWGLLSLAGTYRRRSA